MAFEMIQAGKYVAKVENWDLVPGYKDGGAPLVEVTVGFEDHTGAHRTLRWRGGLETEKGRAMTLKTLFTLGFRSKELIVLTDKNIRALDTETPVEIVVDHYVGKNGQTYARVKWINKLGGAKFQKQFSRNDLAASLSALNVEADLLALAAESGVDLVKHQTALAAADDLPF